MKEGQIISSEELWTFVQTMSDPMFAFDVNGTYGFVNESFAKIFNKSPKDIIGKKPKDIFLPEDAKEREDFFEKIINTGNTDEIEFNLKIGKENFDKIYHVIANLIKKEGKIVSIICVARDITERAILEKVINESYNFNDQIINNAEEGIIVYDLNLKYKLWNPYMEKITGISANDVIGKFPSDLFDFLLESGQMERLQKILLGEKLEPFDIYYDIPSTGKSGWVIDKSTALHNAEGKIIGIITTTSEISERKKAQQALEDYVHMLNHDLRNPLGPMIGYSGIFLNEDFSDEEIRKFILLVNTSAKRMLKMMEEYLLISKLEKGKNYLHKEAKPIFELIEIIKNTFSSLNENKCKLKILLKNFNNNLCTEDFIGKSININITIFESIITNLLNNAIQALTGTEGSITINIFDETCFYLAITNQGEIPKEKSKTLFKKFASDKKEGTGLGLYGSKIMAVAHGGNIAYQSLPGETRFILKLSYD